jgi:hypothetical protein
MTTFLVMHSIALTRKVVNREVQKFERRWERLGEEGGGE